MAVLFLIVSISDAWIAVAPVAVAAVAVVVVVVDAVLL